MKFFNLDLHVSVIEDVTHFLKKFGHEVTSWNISGHSWVFGKEPRKVNGFNFETWSTLDEQACNDFYNYYSNFLDNFNAYIVTYASSVSLLYEKANKPIILVVPTRYENPFTGDQKKIDWLNQFLKKKYAVGELFVIANNKGDQNYFEHFTGIKPTLIPSICNYTNCNYEPRKNYFTLQSRLKKIVTTKYQHYIQRYRSISNIRNLSNKLYYTKHKLGNRHSWKDLYSAKGIVHLPYQISTMSIFEQYTACVPLFFPSKNFISSLHAKYPNAILSELSFYQVKDLAVGELSSTNPNNIKNTEVLNEWIENADYYDNESMPFISYFDNYEDLNTKLQNSDLFKISKNMKEHNKYRYSNATKKWKQVINEI